jgi:hypothetical protein
MTGNMTRDSNAPYQQGWTAVASQFFGYQMRLMEQMMGSKLSTAEKARLFTATSLIYGVPSGLGLTFGVAPMREWMKSWLRQEGVQTDNTILEPFVDGFASEFLKAVTGTSFDVASSYGPSGINNFGDLVTGDASLFNLIAGASGGIIWQAAADSDPIIKGLFSLMNPFDKDKFPILAQDWLQPLSEISSANTVIKLWKAINMGALISKNENKMTNTTPLEDWITATLSVVPQRVSDAFSDISAMNTIKAEKSSDEKQMVADYRRGVLALKAGDKGLAQTYFNRVIIRGHSAGFNPNDFQQMYRRAMKDTPLDESVLQQINKMFQGNN